MMIRLRSKSASVVFAVGVFLFTTLGFTQCNNYGLVDRLENPMGFVSCTSKGPCHIFVATNNGTNFTGNLGGIQGADALCNASSDKPNDGTYKALLVDGVNRRACVGTDCAGAIGLSDAIDWVLYPNTSYVNSQNNTIGTTTANGIFTATLLNAIASPPVSLVWTGIGASWIPDNANNCQNWSSISSGSFGGTGDPTKTDTSSFSSSSATCSAPQGLYCAQQ